MVNREWSIVKSAPVIGFFVYESFTHDSPLTIDDSRFTIDHSLLTIHYSEVELGKREIVPVLTGHYNRPGADLFTKSWHKFNTPFEITQRGMPGNSAICINALII
jgi:hypothetical protein